VADGAFDIDCFSTCSTDHMVVVVTDPILIAGRRTGRLDAPDVTLLGEDFEGVVYSLSRNGTDFGTNVTCDVFRRAGGPTRHSPEYGQTLGRDLDTVLAKKVNWIIRHKYIIGQIMDSASSETCSRETSQFAQSGTIHRGAAPGPIRGKRLQTRRAR
jgi:hypothetical protein